LFQIYVKDYVECPTCKSPDTKIVKENRISFLVCEAWKVVHGTGQLLNAYL